MRSSGPSRTTRRRPVLSRNACDALRYMERHPRQDGFSCSGAVGGTSLRSEGFFRVQAPTTPSPEGPLWCCWFLYVCLRLKTDLQHAHPARPKLMLCKPAFGRSGRSGLYITSCFGQSGRWCRTILVAFLPPCRQRLQGGRKVPKNRASLGVFGMLFSGRCGFATTKFIAGIPCAASVAPILLIGAKAVCCGGRAVVPPPPSGAGAFGFS